LGAGVQEGSNGGGGLLEQALLVVGAGRAVEGALPFRALAGAGDGDVDGYRLLPVAIVKQLVGRIEVKRNVRRRRRGEGQGCGGIGRRAAAA
jgi:hypothetical protein